MAAANQPAREKVIAHLEQRFRDCAGGAHPNLIRQDILQSMRHTAERLKDEQILPRA